MTERDGKPVKCGVRGGAQVGAPLSRLRSLCGREYKPWQHEGGRCELVSGVLSREVPARGPQGARDVGVWGS